MPDVGVLNLQIHDDSEKAAQGLENLVGVLNRVKDACDFGRNLGTVAKNLNAIGKVINDSIQGSTIAKLNEMADALAKMQNIGKVNIRISYGKEDEFAAVARAFEQTKADSHGIISNIREAAGQTGAVTSGFAEVGDRIAEDITRVEKLNETIRNVSKSAQKFDYSKFDPANLPMGALGATLREAETKWAQYKDKVQDTDRFVQQIGTSMNAIIPYTEKNENSWESISERIREAARAAKEEYKKACEEALKAAQKLNSEIANKVRAFPKRTIEDYYHGMRFERNDDGTDSKIKVKDILSEQLRGMGTPNEQLYAFKTVAKELGMTVEEVKAKVEALRAAESGVGEQAMHGIDAMNKSLSLNERLTEKARNAFARIKEEAAGLKGGFSKLFPTITSLVKGFGRIAKYRVLRAILKQISSGISEGVQNVYFYSKAVGTSLAPAMDSAASALLQMKNSIGAAVAPVIESLVPVLQTVVDWFITAVNYANQFFALIRGQKTWTRAVPATTNAFDDQTKAAKSAGAAIKDLLADWDELNIIQSESGGGGTVAGADAATEYLNMFEEVSTFNNDVKNIVDFLKDNMNDILRIAEGVGAAILAWKVSGAFTGILGTIGGLAGAVFTLGIVAEVSSLFTNELLKTGDPGWLVGDVIATCLGGLFTKALLTKVLGKEAAEIAIPLTFAVSAGATIIANIEDTDVGALSKESLLADATAALEGSVVGGSLGYMFGNTLGAALVGGTVGLIGTFGIAIGLKADAQVIADGITEENIKAKLIGIGSLGISGAVLGAEQAAAAGTSIAAGAAGMAMLFGGASIATFGVAIGINAINKTAEAGEITQEVIEKNLLSGGVIGAGLALVAGSVIGSAAAVAITAVGGAALAIGALFGIEAIIAKQPKKIQWGNYKATRTEIEAFVSEALYKNPPSVTISTLKTTIDNTTDVKKNLGEDITELIGTIYAVKLGILTTPDEMKTQIDTFIGDYNKTTAQLQETLQVALSIAPITTGGETDSETTEGIVKRSQDRWTELNGIMTNLGEQLADAYTAAYDARMSGNLDEAAEKTIQEISDMMTKVAQAIATGQARAKAGHAIRMQLQNLSKGTLNDLLDEVRAQRDQLIKELTEARTEAAEGVLAQQYAYEELAKYRLEEVGGNVMDATYQHYISMAKEAKADYETMLANMKADVQAAADNLLDKDTQEALRKAVLKYMNREVTLDNWTNANGGLYSETFEAIQDLWAGDESVLQGKKAKQNVYDMMTNFIIASFAEEDRATVKKAIYANAVTFSDFVDKEIMDSLADTLGITGEKRNIWDMYVEELLGNGVTAEPEVQVEPDVTVVNENEVQEKLRQAINEAMADGVIDANEMVSLSLITDADSLNNMLEELGYQIGGAFGGDGEYEIETDYNGPSSYPTTQTTYTPSNITPTGSGEVTDINVTLNESDISGGVREGTSDLSRGISDLGQMIATWLPRIYNKDTTVKFTPSTAAGAWSRISATYYSDTTGMEP